MADKFVLRIESSGHPGVGKSTALDFIKQKFKQEPAFKDLEFIWEDVLRKILVIKGRLS